MLKIFAKYMTVGAANTLIHWSVFSAYVYLFGKSQAIANLAGFLIAVSFSFFMNASFTFQAKATAWRYLAYLAFMGVLSAATGWAADSLHVNPMITLVSFSLISLVCGFLYSKLVIFKGA